MFVDIIQERTQSFAIRNRWDYPDGIVTILEATWHPGLFN